MCFCREIRSAFLGNLDTDDVARYQVGTFAIATCQDIVKDRNMYDFKRVDNDNLGAYLISKECMEHVSNKFSINNGDIFLWHFKNSDTLNVRKNIELILQNDKQPKTVSDIITTEDYLEPI